MGIKLRSTSPDDGTKKFLIQIMDQLEQQKVQLGAKVEDSSSAQTHCQNFALRVFKLADDEGKRILH